MAARVPDTKLSTIQQLTRWMTYTTSMHYFPNFDGIINAYLVSQCRFGNFIGEAVESDDEGQRSENGADAYVDYDENASAVPDEGHNQQLMELDGMWVSG